MERKDLDYGFTIVGDASIRQFGREVYQKYYKEIDFASFEIIQSNGSSFHYFRDKNKVYLESYMNAFTVLEDADPADFEIIDFKEGLSTSCGNDYVFEQKLPYRLRDAEPLSCMYQQVGDKIYCAYSKEVEGADVTTFEVLHGERVGNVAKDKQHVYFRDVPVSEADALSFHFLDACFNSGYYRECDHTFYAIDAYHAFYVDTIAKAFKVIKTKNLDQFRFEIWDELGYAKDIQYTYLFGKRVKYIK